ncbi:hypothetical protein DFH28DRAFT_1194276 [Melampsora americana]|nr:hypothetical protein DFH28DRAFT_1194276 [Melampsora americana]
MSDGSSSHRCDKFQQILGKSKVASKRKYDAQTITSDKTQTLKITSIENSYDSKGKKVLPGKAKFKTSNLSNKALDNQNSFKSLEYFQEVFDSNGETEATPVNEQNKELQRTSEALEETEDLHMSKSYVEVVDPVKIGNDQRILKYAAEHLDNREEDLSAEQSPISIKHKGDERGFTADVDEAALYNPKGTDEMIMKDVQQRSKTSKNNKGKKKNKTKKGKNNSKGKHTTISSFDTEFLEPSDRESSRADGLLTLEELLKLDVEGFLKYFLKSHDTKLYLPIVLSDVEFGYLITSNYLKNAEVWNPAREKFMEKFGHWGEAIRRLRSLRTQFEEKKVVWEWNRVKDELPKYALTYVELLHPNEEFATFRHSNLNLWNIYLDKEKSIQKRDSRLIKKVFGIFGSIMDKRVVTFDLMSHYNSDFLKDFYDSGAVKEGIDLPILIIFDQCLRLSYENGWLDESDKDGIQYKASALIKVMLGTVIGFSGKSYVISGFEWVSEITRSYLTRPGTKIANLVEERIKNLAYLADHLKVKIPECLKDYIPESAKGLGLGEVLLSTHAGLKLEALVKLKNLLNLNDIPDTKPQTKPSNKKRTGIIGVWASIQNELLLEAVNVKRYCDLRGQIIIDLNAHISQCNLESFL